MLKKLLDKDYVIVVILIDLSSKILSKRMGTYPVIFEIFSDFLKILLYVPLFYRKELVRIRYIILLISIL